MEDFYWKQLSDIKRKALTEELQAIIRLLSAEIEYRVEQSRLSYYEKVDVL